MSSLIRSTPCQPNRHLAVPVLLDLYLLARGTLSTVDLVAVGITTRP